MKWGYMRSSSRFTSDPPYLRYGLILFYHSHSAYSHSVLFFVFVPRKILDRGWGVVVDVVHTARVFYSHDCGTFLAEL